MKLLNKIMLWFTAIVLLVTPISMYVSYNNIKHRIDNAESQRMQNVNDIVAGHIAKGQMPETYTQGRPISITKVAALPKTKHQVNATCIYNNALKRNESILTVSSYYPINGSNYKISSYNYVTKSNQIFTGMMNALVWKILLILLGVFIAGRLLSAQIIAPFNKTLKAIHNFNLKKKEKLNLPPTGIKEFEELNTFLKKMTDKAIEDYSSVKEFSENASHELQTPLAVIRTKLELLANTDISASQASLISDMQNAIEKLSKINRSLTILTKLDNKEFETQESIQFDKAAQEVFEVYADRINLKDIKVEYQSDKKVPVKMHPALADMLLNNLVGNAIRHNIDGGTIHTELSSKHFSISNTGLPPEIPTDELFKRFKKSNQCAESIGLGLSIVQQICQVSNFDLSYVYNDGWHTIQVQFNNN